MKLNLKKSAGIAVGTIAGAAAAKIGLGQLLYSPTGFLFKIVPNQVKPAVPIALGLVLAGNKNDMVRGAGLGMIAVGGLDLVSMLMAPKAGAAATTNGLGAMPRYQAIGNRENAKMYNINGKMYAINGGAADQTYMNGFTPRVGEGRAQKAFMNGGAADETYMNGVPGLQPITSNTALGKHLAGLPHEEVKENVLATQA